MGRGAEFTVRIPLSTPAAPPGVRRDERATPPGAGRRVLVVEDNEDAAATLRDLLELDGHEVLVARDGQEGLDAALAHAPDVILCDVGLPVHDGYEVARRLRAAGSRALLVALTGYAAPEDVQRARAAGFDRHLAKPADPATLAAILVLGGPG